METTTMSQKYRIGTLPEKERVGKISCSVKERIKRKTYQLGVVRSWKPCKDKIVLNVWNNTVKSQVSEK